MHIKTLRIRNFRRLKDVTIELEEDSTILVGSNNSGKTSAMQALLYFFKSDAKRFDLHDFSADCWAEFDRYGKVTGDDEQKPLLFPTITLDVWFHVDRSDLYRVVSILPSLDWADEPLGIRLEFAPNDPDELLARFRLAQKGRPSSTVESDESLVDDFYKPWPDTLCDYLNNELSREYSIHYYILEYDSEFNQNRPDCCEPIPLASGSESSAKILHSLVRVDALDAQRYLSDTDTQGHTQSLSRRLSSFYRRNLEQHEWDYESRKALAFSERNFNKHLSKVFADTLQTLNSLGYPGFAEPNLVIKAVLDSDRVISHNTSVHYSLRKPDVCSPQADDLRTLPDRYNGLGFKNLIYMAIEILDYREQWRGEEDNRAPLHLVLVEEPEAHLHVQLQQVFIRKIREAVNKSEDCGPQMIITTHSPHIIDEREYTPVRYFRRNGPALAANYSDVVNLASLNSRSDDGQFLQRYLRLTHCDLFFADAVVLVEGNVERLLMTRMIEKCAKSLRTNYLTVLDVGGAFAYRFASLIDLLSIPALVITDLDSVDPGKKRAACRTGTEGAVTSNNSLRYWFPDKEKILDLLGTPDDEKVLAACEDSPSNVRLAYQTRTRVVWKEQEIVSAGRTLEEAFILENLPWLCEGERWAELGIPELAGDLEAVDAVLKDVYSAIRNENFKKTEFALALLVADDGWKVPEYISTALEWLSKELESSHSPVQLPEEGK